MGSDPPEENDFASAPCLDSKPSPTPPRILFAMSATNDHREALQRAYAFASTQGGELIVLSVLPPLERGGLFQRARLQGALRSLEMGKRALRQARQLCREVLPDLQRVDDIIVLQGDFLSTLVRVVREYQASMIVLPPSELGHGRRATELARVTHVPVLIARAPGSTETIIAASDLQDHHYPVLQRANLLSQRLDAPMVFVHNLRPLSSPTEEEAFGEEALHAKKRQLRCAMESLDASADTIVLKLLNTADAILSVARQKRADLIVIGAHRRSWLNNLLSVGVAAQVAERANRSVLIDPLC